MKTIKLRLGKDKLTFHINNRKRVVHGTISFINYVKGDVKVGDYITTKVSSGKRKLVTSVLKSSGLAGVINNGGRYNISIANIVDIHRPTNIKALVKCSPDDHWDPIVGIGVCILKLYVKRYLKKSWPDFKVWIMEGIVPIEQDGPVME